MNLRNSGLWMCCEDRVYITPAGKPFKLRKNHIAYFEHLKGETPFIHGALQGFMIDGESYMAVYGIAPHLKIGSLIDCKRTEFLGYFHQKSYKFGKTFIFKKGKEHKVMLKSFSKDLKYYNYIPQTTTIGYMNDYESIIEKKEFILGEDVFTDDELSEQYCGNGKIHNYKLPIKQKMFTKLNIPNKFVPYSGDFTNIFYINPQLALALIAAQLATILNDNITIAFGIGIDGGIFVGGEYECGLVVHKGRVSVYGDQATFSGFLQSGSAMLSMAVLKGTIEDFAGKSISYNGNFDILGVSVGVSFIFPIDKKNNEYSWKGISISFGIGISLIPVGAECYYGNHETNVLFKDEIWKSFKLNRSIIEKNIGNLNISDNITNLLTNNSNTEDYFLIQIAAFKGDANIEILKSIYKDTNNFIIKELNGYTKYYLPYKFENRLKAESYLNMLKNKVKFKFKNNEIPLVVKIKE